MMNEGAVQAESHRNHHKATGDQTSIQVLTQMSFPELIPSAAKQSVCVCVFFPALPSVGGSAPSLLLSVFPQPLWWSVSSVCPSISHLLWIWRRLALRGPQKKLHTLQFDKNVSEHLSHLSELVVNTRSRLFPLRTQESVCVCLYLLHTSTKILILQAKWGHFWDIFRSVWG